MWQETATTLLQSAPDAIIGLALIMLLGYMLINVRNQSKMSDMQAQMNANISAMYQSISDNDRKDNDNLATIVQALSQPLAHLATIQDKLTTLIEAQGNNTRTVVNATSQAVIDGLAENTSVLTSVNSHVLGLKPDLDKSINEGAQKIMDGLQPLSELHEIRRLLDELKSSVDTIQESINAQQQGIDSVNTRLGVIEERTDKVIKQYESKEGLHDVSKDTKQLATNSNNPVNNSADSIGNQSSAGASPVGGVS